ncbi:hypothetical protein OIU78_017311 [Salix suchowensis]|nr:hypothetical protein OIU78_017311 [Salix suchowensis]
MAVTPVALESERTSLQVRRTLKLLLLTMVELILLHQNGVGDQRDKEKQKRKGNHGDVAGENREMTSETKGSNVSGQEQHSEGIEEEQQKILKADSMDIAGDIVRSYEGADNKARLMDLGNVEKIRNFQVKPPVSVERGRKL